MSPITPNLAGYAEAQDRLRLKLGGSVTFIWPEIVTFAPTAAKNMFGELLDPMQASAIVASSQASASAMVAVSFRAARMGGQEVAAPIGRGERTRVMLNVASADGFWVMGQGPLAPVPGSAAILFEYVGERFEIYAMKTDNIVGNYQRLLVYGAAIGADDSSTLESGHQ